MTAHCLSLAATRPDVLQQTIPLSEAVEGVIAFAHGANETGQSVDLIFAGVTTVLVNLADRNLDRGMVLRLDDAIGRRALAGNITG